MVIVMKFKLKRTKLQILLEIVSFCILAAMFIYLAVRWGDVPDKIPGHYNAAGQIDRWGNKMELIMMPLISLLLYLLITVVSFFPSIWNVPVQITDKNRDKVYGNMMNMVLFMKIEMLLCFTYLNYTGIKAIALSPFFLPVFLVSIFGTIIYFIVRLYRTAGKIH